MPARSKRYNEDRSGIVRCSWHGARLKGAYLHSRHCTRLGIVDATSVSTNRLSLLHSQILSVRGSKERNEERTSDRPTTSRIRNSHCHRIREFFFLLFPPPPPEESKNYMRLPPLALLFFPSFPLFSFPPFVRFSFSSDPSSSSMRPISYFSAVRARAPLPSSPFGVNLIL